MKKQPRRSSDFVHEIAPGERKKLSEWIREENHDRKAFPELFHDGQFGLHDKNRKRKITATQNYSHKVLNINRKYAQSSDYVFVGQQYLERHSFENHISVSLQRGIQTTAADGSKEIKTNNAIDVFKAIPGTPAYWKAFRNEIFARMEQLGNFHFFFTLSSAEMKWPEVATSILHAIGRKITYTAGWENDENKIEIDGVPLPKYKEDNWRNKSQDYKNNFLLITRIFDNKVKAFVKLLTGSGEVEHFAYRIEFQIRGMPHVHGVFWLRKDIIEKYKTGGEYDDEKITELIDEWISCSLDTGHSELDKLVNEVNVHNHTKSCQKGKSFCRFHFPRLPSNKTLIAGPLSADFSEEEKKETLMKYKGILEAVKGRLSELTDNEVEEIYANNLQSFLAELDITLEEYEEALKTSERGKVVILKRTLKERNVNNYNKEWMLAWKGNLDIQFVYDGYAVVTYCTDYLSKADAGITAALKQALQETKGCNDFDRLNYMKRCFFTHRQVSVAEAAYRLIPGMNLKHSNTKSLFVSSGYPENRSNLYRKVGDDDHEQLESEGEDQSTTNFKSSKELFSIPGRKGKFQATDTIHKKYSNRPVKLEDLCLAQFAVSYDSCVKPAKNVTFLNGSSKIKGTLQHFGTKKNLPKFICLNTGSFMRLRESQSILRIHSSKKKKGDESMYAELLLFLPWRNEDNLKRNCR